MPHKAQPDVQADLEEETRLAMRAAVIFAGITAESLARAGDSVTMSQLRVLFLASDGDTLNTTAVAEALDIHLSNASRVCDRLVTAGFLNRRESAADRRNVQLSLTPTGRELVSSVVAHRRATFLRVLQRMSPGQRAELAAGLRSFSDAADEDAGHRPTQP